MHPHPPAPLHMQTHTKQIKTAQGTQNCVLFPTYLRTQLLYRNIELSPPQQNMQGLAHPHIKSYQWMQARLRNAFPNFPVGVEANDNHLLSLLPGSHLPTLVYMALFHATSQVFTDYDAAQTQSSIFSTVTVWACPLPHQFCAWLVRDSWQLSNVIEGSLEVKLPTVWTDEKQSREEAERRERLEERRVEEKE